MVRRKFWMVMLMGACFLLALPAAAQQSLKDRVSRLLDETYNKGNLAAVDALFAADYVRHPGETGQNDFKIAVLSFRAAMPDLKATQEVALEQDNFVAARLRVRGTFTEELVSPSSPPIAPNNRVVDVVFNMVFRFNAEGKIVEEWDAFSSLSLSSQISATTFFDSPAAEAMLYPDVVDVGMSAQNREVVSQYFDALNRGDWGYIDTHFKEDFAAHTPFGKLDRAGLAADLDRLRGALPDLKASVEQLITEGNWTAARYTLSGTFSKNYVFPDGGPVVPPTHGTLNLPVITFFRFEQQGLVAEYFELYDGLRFLAQLELLQFVQVPTPAR